eukprot:4865218-Amphidinium_carterae.1
MAQAWHIVAAALLTDQAVAVQPTGVPRMWGNVTNGANTTGIITRGIPAHPRTSQRKDSKKHYKTEVTGRKLA